MYKKGDRVVVQADFETPLNELRRGDIVTTNQVIINGGEEIAIVCHGYDEETNKAKIIGIPTSLIRLANKKDLKNVNYDDVVHPRFRINSEFIFGQGSTFESIKQGDKGVLKDAELFVNEYDDTLYLEVNDDIHDFKRSFIEMYFHQYDDELDGLDEIDYDMKSAEKNYFITGARMMLNRDKYPEDENKIVIFIGKDDLEQKYEVENLIGEVVLVDKDDLRPFEDLESLYNSGEIKNFVQEPFGIGKKYVANSTDKHLLLGDIPRGQIVEIVSYLSINVNVFEDIIVVKDIRTDKEYNINYYDLKEYFLPASEKQVKTYLLEDHKKQCEEEIEEIVEEILLFNELKDTPEESPITIEKTVLAEKEKELLIEQGNKDFFPDEDIKIHELSIRGYRFKIDEEYFEFNGKNYSKEEIDSLILSLEKLKKYL